MNAIHSIAALSRPTVVAPVPTGRTRRIEADNDPAAIAAWLSRHAGKPTTLANCRKEVERFYLWIESRNMGLADVCHEDVMRYRAFLGNPPPKWVSATPYPRLDPRWCPFRGPLSAASIRQAEIVLAGMFAWLADAEYLKANPFALSDRPKDLRTRTIERFLTRAQLQKVFDVLDAAPSETPQERRRSARDRWMVHLLYLTGMRASEAATHVMGSFVRRESPSGHRWALAVTGKGGKERVIPATPALLEELRRFRAAMGLSALPGYGETAPLLPSLRGGASLTRFGVYRALATILDAAVDCCDDPADKARLRSASTHWLRHSRGTHLVANDANLKTVQELLGHSSLTTTSRYVHGELDRMQDDIERADRAI